MMKNIADCAGKEEKSVSSIEYRTGAHAGLGEKLARNLALSGLLVLAVVSVRSAKLPSGETVLTAVQNMIDPSWEDQLGKISFVSQMLPESVSVFFESPAQIQLTAPCFGEIQHPWTEQEPYIGYSSPDGRVFAAAAGQVMSVSHGQDEERIIRIRHENGLETLYYQLSSVQVKEGDPVTVSTCLAQTMDDCQALLEVRRAGRPIDPGVLLLPREAAP